MRVNYRYVDMQDNNIDLQPINVNMRFIYVILKHYCVTLISRLLP